MLKATAYGAGQRRVLRKDGSIWEWLKAYYVPCPDLWHSNVVGACAPADYILSRLRAGAGITNRAVIANPVG
jgi:hypothetical protein